MKILKPKIPRPENATSCPIVVLQSIDNICILVPASLLLIRDGAKVEDLQCTFNQLSMYFPFPMHLEFSGQAAYTCIAFKSRQDQ